ncbi:hypothetical protein ACOMHN_050074 [Nucella lapillus]
MDRTGVGTVCVWIWAVVFVVHGQIYVNVARGKTYNQSSKWDTQGPSSKAANGQTGGSFPTNCIHTAENGDLNPWWEVDLDQPYPVYNIDLWARATFKERLYPSVITVDNKTCAKVTTFPSDTRNQTVTCSAIMKGQTVRITRQGNTGDINGDRTLNMCEMEIYVCTDGWYGQQCSTRCSPGCQNTTCDRQSAECSPCNAGYNGTRCAECQDGYYTNSTMCFQCSSNCQSGMCNKTTGVCKGCVPGRYGDQCSTSCPTGCLNACDQQSGNCSSCKGGWYGDQCSSNCSSGCDGNVCQQSGECSPCKEGWYGGLCSVACPSGCLSACDQQSGKCASCKDGLHGDQCSTRCPTGCLNDRCLQSGLCSSCKAGYTGSNCSGCQDGYYTNSTMCSKCSSNCRPGMCDKTTGVCDGCVEGRYGDTCSSECQTANCQQCDQKTGAVCTQCTLFRQPPACTDCLDGHHKRSDNSGCSICTWSCKSGTVCDKTTGHCESCPPGKQGNNCQQDIDDNTGLIVGAVIGAIVAIVIVVIIIVIVRKRKRATKSHSTESEMTSRAQNGGERERGRGDTGPSGSTSLSFDPVTITDDKKEAKPQAKVKPMTKPAIKPRPSQARDNIYQNVSLSHERPAPSAPPAATSQRAASNAHGPNSDPLTDDEELDSVSGRQELIYSNDPSYTSIIPLDQLQQTLVDSLKDSKIANEFRFMDGFKRFPITIARRQENYYKNRFKTIVPYDKNRVVLERVNGDDSSDYINASFIKGYKTNKAYIAAAGPKPNTQDDFWRMVWQERITDIVMLTNVQEGIKEKCHEYWPAKGKSLNTGHVEITGQEEEERADFVIRTFSVRKLQSPEQRQVRQYHYVKWMDHEVPATTPLVDFWRYLRARAPRTATAPPLLVHCSAGVGRTGTYIALDILMEQSQHQQDISLYSTVDNLRNYRCHMVQNKSQYQFLHEAVLEAYMSGDSRLNTSSFDSAFPASIRHDQPHPRIDAQYQTLCQMKTDLIQPSHTTASLEENRQKNRNPQALPDDKHLVYITAYSEGRNQYINAVYMPTFLSSRGSIVTQLPLADTVIDLWRLVDSWDISTIVSIGPLDTPQGSCRYWPQSAGETMTCGNYKITWKSMTSPGKALRNYTVEMKKQDTSRDLRVLHYEAWTGEVADNVPDLLNLLDTLHTAHKQSTDDPIIIQCIDGVARSGALCALWDVISRVTCDDDVDVYFAVRHVHTVRPEAISSLVQYRFLYKVVQQYIQSHCVYSNT